MSQTDQTLQALQMQLMKRERQVADFEAKMKKNQFKHSRDLKECKIAEERAKTLLKQEKARVDRLNKSAKQKQQQNNLLTKRLQELRQEKQREVTELRAQYNMLKEEVRSYERILPTLTFLNELNLRIESIPTYQEIFLNLKTKVQQLLQTEHKFAGFKIKNEEITKTLKQNQQMARKSKQQIDKKLKEILPKIADYELKLSQSKSANEELKEANESLKEEVSVWTEKAEGLQAAVRQHELKLEELDRAYSYQLMSKEEQIRALTQQEFDRYQQQLRSLEHRLEIKDKMYLQQVSILEEEVYFLQSRTAEQKQHFQENYLLIKREIERMREEVEKQRFQHDQLKEKYAALEEKYNNVSKSKDLIEVRVASLDKKIEQMKEAEKNRVESFSDVHMSQLENLQEKYAQLRQQHEQSNSRLSHYEQENKQLEQEVSILKNELGQKNTPKPHALELPGNFLQFEVEGRRSSEGGGTSRNSIEIEEIVLEKTRTIDKAKKQHIRTQSKQDENTSSIKKERDQFKVQILQLKQDNSELTSKLSEKEQALSSMTKNYKLLESKVQSQAQQINLLNQEHKREKDTNNKLRQELKLSKENNAQLAQKHLKEKKEINSQFEIYRSERDKLKSQYAAREKSLTQELTTLKHKTSLHENQENVFQKIKSELQYSGMVNKEQEAKITLLQQQLQELNTKLEQLEQQYKKQEKYSSTLEEMLARQRKERSLLAVPSLEQLNNNEQKTFNDIYAIVTQKESEINFLERQVSDLKQQLQGLKESHIAKLQAFELQQNDYIQTIIDMKMRCAQSEMKASESQYLYNQLKKKHSIK